MTPNDDLSIIVLFYEPQKICAMCQLLVTFPLL